MFFLNFLSVFIVGKPFIGSVFVVIGCCCVGLVVGCFGFWIVVFGLDVGVGCLMVGCVVFVGFWGCFVRFGGVCVGWCVLCVLGWSL